MWNDPRSALIEQHVQRNPNDEGGLMWNDPAIGIGWPALEGDAEFDPSKIILSDKDKLHPSLTEV